MTGAFKAALVQTTAGPNPAANADANVQLLHEAAGAGADFVMFPEVCNMIEPDREQCRAKARPAADDETLTRLREGAAELGVWVLVGSIVAQSEDMPGKLANRSFMIDDQGAIVGEYDKMHLFDVDVGSGDVYRESDTYRPGTNVTLVPTPWGVFGMTVCYDMRFPHLYRDLARAGAVMLSAPSAFTRPTGEAHWHVLLRARAIECGAFVFAPAQTGDHAGGRKTYGHSLAVGPWGEVLADGGTAPGITYVDIDTSKALEARKRIPSLLHDRDYSL
ncbi:MAG: carbon-nitrogen hydrolase family protein [Rhodospirillales bacterium]|nr:carbon-nitrogen hydrolase family protein [Rhodospirillales bacterium]MBO6788043.1 carbon-nitrogen hydrolase family protein [Rhodospirillales bacterium]